MARLSKEEKHRRNLQELLYKTTELLLEKVEDSSITASEISNIIKLLNAEGMFKDDTNKEDSWEEILPFRGDN